MEGGAAKKEGENLPPGFRFHPTDEELISYYLTHRISEPNFDARAVADVDLNKCEPWDLPGKAKMGEKEWFFFSLRDRKYPTGVRTNRATAAGYWKTTGKDKEIYNSETSELVGMKKTLVFYKGRAPRGEKSNWVMHEYRLQSRPTYKPNKDEWVVCRVFMKRPGVKKYTTQPRATNPYTIDMSNATMMPNSLLHTSDPYHQLGISRSHHLSHAELVELARYAKGQQGYSLPIQPQPQLNFPNNFALSGLNLNVGAQQQMLRAMPVNEPGMLLGGDGAYSGEIGSGSSNNNVGNGGRFQNVECADLEGYWATY